MKLIKASEPGWEKEVDTRYKACKILWPYICDDCRNGFARYVGIEEIEHHTIATEFDLDSMLRTCCGCEFWFEEE